MWKHYNIIEQIESFYWDFEMDFHKRWVMNGFHGIPLRAIKLRYSFVKQQNCLELGLGLGVWNNAVSTFVGHAA